MSTYLGAYVTRQKKEKFSFKIVCSCSPHWENFIKTPSAIFSFCKATKITPVLHGVGDVQVKRRMRPAPHPFWT